MRRLALLVALAAVVGTANAPATSADSGAVVRFLSPRPLSTVLGRSELVIEIAVPEGRTARRVEIAMNGRPLATLEGPPWAVRWDAGPEGGDHRLDATLVLDDGTTATASVRTSRLRIDQVEEVALVTLYAIAKDGGGRYVTDLGREDFRLFENGRPQEIDRFSSERRPLRVAMVLDASLSMSMQEDRIGPAREAALEFVDALEPGDEGMVATFADDVRILQELTSDKDLLRSSLARIETGGGTALYDAIWTGAERLREFDGRRVLVLLSDGKDEAASAICSGICSDCRLSRRA